MSTRASLLHAIARFCATTGCTERQLGERAVKNPKIVARIRRGEHVTTDTIERLECVMAAPPAIHPAPDAAAPTRESAALAGVG